MQLSPPDVGRLLSLFSRQRLLSSHGGARCETLVSFRAGRFALLLSSLSKEERNRECSKISHINLFHIINFSQVFLNIKTFFMNN